MAARFARKPDPAIKRNVRHARAAAVNAKRAHASVVATSIAATLLAWALFSNQDAQALRAAQLEAAAQTVAAVAAPPQDASGPQIIVTIPIARLNVAR